MRCADAWLTHGVINQHIMGKHDQNIKTHGNSQIRNSWDIDFMEISTDLWKELQIVNRSTTSSRDSREHPRTTDGQPSRPPAPDINHPCPKLCPLKSPPNSDRRKMKAPLQQKKWKTAASPPKVPGLLDLLGGLLCLLQKDFFLLGGAF